MDPSGIVGPDSVPLPGSDIFVLGSAIVVLGAAIVALGALGVFRFVRRRRGHPARGRLAPAVLGGTAVVALVLALMSWPFGFFVPKFPSTPQLFPDAAFFYRPVSDLDVADDSATTVEAIGERPLMAATSSAANGMRTRGIPFNLVDEDTPTHTFDFTYPGISDDTAYPIAEPAYVQSMPLYRTDNHYVAIDLENRRMWELASIRRWFSVWQATAGAVWNLDSLDYPKGRATASGLPLKPLTFTYPEVASGTIGHALTLSMPTVAPGKYRWPARATDGRSDVRDAPMMGTWFRLSEDADLSQLGPQARAIAEALQKYGAVLADTGGSVALAGETDARWDDDDLATLGSLTSSDLEVVDASGLMVDPGSMEAIRKRENEAS